MKISEHDLLLGSIHSLEAASSFLRDANFLYKNARYSSACIVGIIAAEHLGKSLWLMERRNEVQKSGKLDEASVVKGLRNHEDKLRYAVVSYESSIPDSLVPKYRSLLSLDGQSTAYASIRNEIETVLAKQMKCLPSDFHALRCRAQYVDLKENSKEWNRPT